MLKKFTAGPCPSWFHCHSCRNSKSYLKNSTLNKFEQASTSLDNLKQFQTRLNTFEPSMTSVNKLDQASTHLNMLYNKCINKWNMKSKKLHFTVTALLSINRLVLAMKILNCGTSWKTSPVLTLLRAVLRLVCKLV